MKFLLIIVIIALVIIGIVATLQGHGNYSDRYYDEYDRNREMRDRDNYYRKQYHYDIMRDRQERNRYNRDKDRYERDRYHDEQMRRMRDRDYRRHDDYDDRY